MGWFAAGPIAKIRLRVDVMRHNLLAVVDLPSPPADLLSRNITDRGHRATIGRKRKPTERHLQSTWRSPGSQSRRDSSQRPTPRTPPKSSARISSPVLAFHSRTVSSQTPDVAIVCSSGDTARLRKSSVRITSFGAPLATSQLRTVRSDADETSSVPSDEKHRFAIIPP